MLPDDTDRGLPPSPPKVRRLLAVAPFLDGGTLRRLRSWTDQTRTLISTVPELGRLSNQRAKPLKGFELLALPGTPEENEAPPDEDSAPLDASLDSRGLHAKLLWAEHAGGATLWLGSPNLTQRAWTRNAEAFAEVGVQLRGGAQAAKSLHEGLETFRNMARPVDPEDLEGETPEDRRSRKAGGIARRQVAARLCARQRHDAIRNHDYRSARAAAPSRRSAHLPQRRPARRDHGSVGARCDRTWLFRKPMRVRTQI